MAQWQGRDASTLTRHATDGKGKVMPCVSQQMPHGDVQCLHSSHPLSTSKKKQKQKNKQKNRCLGGFFLWGGGSQHQQGCEYQGLPTSLKSWQKRGLQRLAVVLSNVLKKQIWIYLNSQSSYTGRGPVQLKMRGHVTTPNSLRKGNKNIWMQLRLADCDATCEQLRTSKTAPINLIYLNLFLLNVFLNILPSSLYEVVMKCLRMQSYLI